MHKLAIEMVLASALVLAACSEDDDGGPDLSSDGSAATALQDASLAASLDSGPAKTAPDSSLPPALSIKTGCAAIEIDHPRTACRSSCP